MVSNPRSADEPRSALAPTIDPRPRWTQLTDAPLGGLALAREAGLVLAWDESHQMYLFDLGGKKVRSSRAPVALDRLAISDDARQIVAVSQDGDLWWLGPSFEPRLQQAKQRNLIGLALSPLGDWLAVGYSDSHTHLFDCYGRRVMNLMTHRPLKHLAFLTSHPYLIGAAEYGLVGCYELDGTPRWQDQLWSSAGHLSVSGEGYAVLVSCYGHGLQRYGLDGTNEGAYHLGGSVARASIDFDGRYFAAATLEGEVLLINAAGQVLWRQTLSKPAKELWIDAVGRFMVCGLDTGEISMIELVPTKWTAADQALSVSHHNGTPSTTAPAASNSSVAALATHQSPPKQLRQPTWIKAGFDDESQAETAVLALVANPIRIAVFSNRKRIEIYTERGELAFKSDPVMGVGRYIDCDSNVVVAATDRDVVVYDVANNTARKLDDRFTQLSHLRIDSEGAELVIVEDRQFVNRFDSNGRRRWVHRLETPLDALALGADRSCALTTEDGRLLILDGERRTMGEFRVAPREALQVIRLGSRWITLAGKAQQVRCHRPDGSVEWQTGLPTEAWRLIRLASLSVARDVSGRTYALDTQGHIVLDSVELPPESVLFVDTAGEPRAIYWRTGNLMVTDLVGRVRWRHVCTAMLGPVAAGSGGVACALGRELAFFSE